MTILLCALVGAVVGGGAAYGLLTPQRRFRRRMALVQAEAMLNYGPQPRRREPPECPVCVARHRYVGFTCEEQMAR